MALWLLPIVNTNTFFLAFIEHMDNVNQLQIVGICCKAVFQVNVLKNVRLDSYLAK